MADKIIIGLVGKIASGKSTVATYLEKKYNGHMHSFSTSMREILARLYLPITRENMQLLSTALRGCFGQNLFSQVIVEDIKQDTSKLSIAENVRRVSDLEGLKMLPNFKLIRIVSDEHARYERLINRNQNADDKNKTFEEFLIEEQAEAELEIPKVMAMAELEVINNGSLEELYQQIDKIIHLNIRLWDGKENS
jgi:dephospho-CoA kinase